ncbi:MAG TPA: helicase C-terminal domain-containing protein [Vicinamibacterales bacterium]|nr:helicase C-terminal domain-containing protein [Vicinamibacterales bacterium]
MHEVPPLSRPPSLTVDEAFANDGPLARAVEQYEARAGQLKMARGVAEVLADGGVLLAEAGTGTGKTMAYLVPAILSGQRVLVSTGTKTLQEQIYFKDLPALAHALPIKFTAAYMKGRNNYLCLHRLDQAKSSLTPGILDSIAEWATTSDTGDRAELEDLPDDSGIWPEISATADTCLGSDCPQYDECFVTRMRQRAAAADVVIVNHHLLCADASIRQSSYGEVIPDCKHLVLDEAHQLEDVATQYFGTSVSNYRVDELVRDGERMLKANVIPDPDGDAQRAVSRVSDHARNFFGDLAMARRMRGRSGEERMRIGPDWFGDIVNEGVALSTALDGFEAVMSLAGGGAGTPASGQSANEDAMTLARRASELREDLQFLLAASNSAYVYFLESRGRGVFLRAAPIDVSAIIKEHVLDRMRATVLTSATLAVAGSFEYARRRLGIGEASELRVPSEFDFATQSLLYLPRKMPQPKSPDFADAVSHQVRAILQRTDGRAFVLFTSYAMMHAVYESLLGAIAFPMIVQGTAPRSVLLKQFRTTPHAVLLATSSFWQGVDVVGEQLSCVVIDKLPFASPGDPITAARIEAINADGGDAFQEYQVPLAILTLLQGLGRLIRHRSDRGVLAVLDPRLRTMGYGRRFLESFPPSPMTQDLAEIERFFAC